MFNCVKKQWINYKSKKSVYIAFKFLKQNND